MKYVNIIDLNYNYQKCSAIWLFGWMICQGGEMTPVFHWEVTEKHTTGWHELNLVDKTTINDCTGTKSKVMTEGSATDYNRLCALSENYN